MADDLTDLDKANRERAAEEERYRDEVSKCGHGAHKPSEKAREQNSAGDSGMESPRKSA
jgi:hypothetical protein